MSSELTSPILYMHRCPNSSGNTGRAVLSNRMGDMRRLIGFTFFFGLGFMVASSKNDYIKIHKLHCN